MGLCVVGFPGCLAGAGRFCALDCESDCEVHCESDCESDCGVDCESDCASLQFAL